MAKRQKAWRENLAASGIAAAMMLGAEDRADAAPWDRTGDAGIFVGYRFGNPRMPSGFSFGVEARAALIDVNQTCDAVMQRYAGAVARIEILGWRGSRFTIGPIVGSTNGSFGYGGEVTAGIARGLDPGLVLEGGAEISGLALMNAHASYALGRDGRLGLGVRFPPLSTSGFCVTGRPLRRHGRRAPLSGAHWATSRLDGSVREAAHVWTRRACLEWASVPAFCELAKQLEACHAPRELVDRARNAAADELRHTMISATLARAVAATPTLTLNPPVSDSRAVATGSEGMVRLAVESFLDGCIGEGTAAEVAAHEAMSTPDPDIRQAQLRIAFDEARHAELAWAILDWTLAVGSDDVRAALLGLLQSQADKQSNEASESDSQGDARKAHSASDLTSFGILAGSSATRIARQQAGLARERLNERLG